MHGGAYVLGLGLGLESVKLGCNYGLGTTGDLWLGSGLGLALALGLRLGLGSG